MKTLDIKELDALAATDIRTAIPMEDMQRVLGAAPFVGNKGARFPQTLVNLRDAGAVPGGSGIPSGRVYRCGTLAHAGRDPTAMAWLAAHVRRVFDLRGSDLGERTEASKDPAVPGVENVWLAPSGSYPRPPSLADFADADADVDGVGAWRAYYLEIANAYRPTFRAVLEHVRDRPREPMLIHCTAGRDRTGVLAGLLHHLAGSSAEVAERDYMLSRIGIEPAREQLVSFAMATVGITDPETPGFWALVQLRGECWRAFVDGLEERFGGWDGYVTASLEDHGGGGGGGLGFSAEDLERIKENMRTE